MSFRFTPTAKNSKPPSSAGKYSTPSSTTPIKPVRAALSTTKKPSSLSRPGLVKQTSACDLRERLRLNSNDVLNTGFAQNSPAGSTSKGKLSAPTAFSASTSNLSATSSATKSLFGAFSATNAAAKRLFGYETPVADRTAAPLPSTPDCFSKVLFDTQTPQNGKRSWDTPQSLRKSADCGDDYKSSEESNLTVAVRVRPMNAKECTTPLVSRSIQVKNTNEVLVKNGLNVDTYLYDNVFCSYDADDTENYANQEAVFNGTALPLIDKAFEGYNACLFAYGQTGSGKTHSMMGTDTDDDDSKPNPQAGIIPRCCYEVFDRINKKRGTFSAQVEVSYFEIYNEKIHDLLAVTPTHLPNTNPDQYKRPELRIREHPQWGPYVENLNIHPVDSNIALKNWLAVGNSQRATAATGMNDKSSRSHSIFSIILTLTQLDSDSSKVTTKRSRINLVDLAGSERVSQTCASGERLKEGVSINRSLLILGQVINALADPKKSRFAPYRDSVLTKLLKESLGGNSKTVMLATISPASLHVDETLATLRYACQARSIINRVKVNEASNDREVNKLRTEVDRLRAQVQFYKQQEIQAIEAPPRKIIIETIDGNPAEEEEKEKLRQQLKDKELELINAQKSWRERLREADNKCKNEMKLLKQNGLALQLSVAQKQPCLINLATDPMLSGTLLYILPPGIVRIGKPKPSTHVQSDIVLDGPLVGLNHCQIDNRRGRLFIRPEMDDCETFVNGELIDGEREIYHGDRIVIGGSHYFRVSKPECSRPNQIEMVDYQTAHQEILQEQEKRLRQQLLSEQQAAFRRIDEERLKNELNYNEKVAQLELQQFRYECSKELIDAEKNAMERNQLNESVFKYRPIESDLCDYIKRLMERPTKEGMHENQLMVKEATQRCRNLGLNYEFVQTLVADESEMLKAVVKIIDRQKNRSAEWPTARLSVWLDLMRDNGNRTTENIFDSVEIKWTENTEEIAMNESLNSSRISLNLSAMKDTLLTKPMKSCIRAIQTRLSPWSPSKCQSITENRADTVTDSTNEPMKKTPKKLTFDDDDDTLTDTPKKCIDNDLNTSTPTAEKFEVQAQKYLSELRKTTLRMKKLCHNRLDENVIVTNEMLSEKVMKALEDIEQSTNEIRRLLKNSEQASPRKTPKSVRFMVD